MSPGNDAATRSEDGGRITSSPEARARPGHHTPGLRRLPDRWISRLRNGDVDGRHGGDGSRVVGAIVLAAVNAGCDRRWLEVQLRDPLNKGGFACLRRRRNRSRWLEGEWARAERLAAAAPVMGDRQTAAFEAQRLAEAADALAWTGMGRATDLSVYRAVLGIAQEAGHLGDLGLPVRLVGERARVGREAAGKSLHRLAERGLLRLVVPGHGRRAGVWEIVRGSTPDNHFPQRPPPEGVCPDCPTCFPRSDAFRWAAFGRRGLGHSKARVFEALGDDAVSSADLARFLRVTARAVRQHLAVLATVGLAERTEDGWRRGTAPPDVVADEIGMAGATFDQRRRHAVERELYRRALSAFAVWAAGPPTYVDEETGEVVVVDELLRERPPPDPVPLLMGAFRGAIVEGAA